jgi:hypothetical protein
MEAQDTAANILENFISVLGLLLNLIATYESDTPSG